MISRILGILFFGSLFALVPVAIVIAGIREGYVNFYQIKIAAGKFFIIPFFTTPSFTMASAG